MRWTDVAVPHGAIVTRAHIELTTDERGSRPTDLVFYAEASDNAGRFANASFDISSRARTTASVTWNDVPAWDTIGETHETPDLSTIVQDVLDRSGWVAGSALVVLVEAGSSNDGPRTAESYNGRSSAAPLLRIEYVEGPDSIPPKRTNPRPASTLPAGTVQTDLSLETDEPATCRYDVISGTGYADMPNGFAITGGASHSVTVTGLVDGSTHTYYVKCADEARNANTDDLVVTFEISDGSPITFEVRVRASRDDAEESAAGKVSYTSSDLELMQEGSLAQRAVGMRWTDVAVPRGAIVTRAYIEFTTDERGSRPADLVFYAEASDDAAKFSNASYDISSRAKTSASAVWNDIPAWETIGETHRTPDLSAIVQQVVDRAVWASGNAFVILVEAGSSNDGPSTAESYNGKSAAAPQLHIEYVN